MNGHVQTSTSQCHVMAGAAVSLSLRYPTCPRTKRRPTLSHPTTLRGGRYRNIEAVRPSRVAADFRSTVIRTVWARCVTGTSSGMHEVPVRPLPLEQLASVIGSDRAQLLGEAMTRASRRAGWRWTDRPVSRVHVPRAGVLRACHQPQPGRTCCGWLNRATSPSCMTRRRPV